MNSSNLRPKYWEGFHHSTMEDIRHSQHTAHVCAFCRDPETMNSVTFVSMIFYGVRVTGIYRVAVSIADISKSMCERKVHFGMRVKS